MSMSPEKRSRERERLRRKPVEPVEELPSFPEPRRINVERQDSLSNKIQTVLGDMGKIHHVIGRDPNVWLGTSRNASVNKNSSAVAAESKDKGTPPKSQTSGYHSQRSKLIPSSRQYTAGTNTSSYSSQPKSTSTFSSASKMSTDQLPWSSEKSSLFNHNSNPYHHKSNSSPGMDSKQLPRLESKSHNTIHNSLRVPSPNQTSNSEELQALDMPVAMESIFQEMRMNEEEPLSEIQTPCPSAGQEFNFSKTESNVQTKFTSGPPGDSNEHMSDGAADNSDYSDSSDDDESDSDESENESPSSKINWSLTEFMPEYQKPAEDLAADLDPSISTDRNTNTVYDQHERTKPFQKSTTRGRVNQKSAQSSEPQNRFDQNKKDLVPSPAKDDDNRKRGIQERFRGRNRPSSVSSLGSLSPVRHRTPAEVQRSSDTLRVPSRERYDRDSPQESTGRENIHKTSQSKSCSPVPRNFEKARSNADLKRLKRLSPKRSSSKSHNTVRPKDIDSASSHSANYHTSSVIPSSVVYGNSSSTQSTVRTHQRTLDKSPSCAPPARHSGRVAEYKAAVSTSPLRDSLSDSSSDEDSDSSSGSSSSSESEDEHLNSNQGEQSPLRSVPWSDNTTHQSSSNVSKIKRKTVDTRAQTVTIGHTNPHAAPSKDAPARKKSRKQLEPNATGSPHAYSQDLSASQTSKTEKEPSKANSASPSVTAALTKGERKYRNSPASQQYQPIPPVQESKRFPSLWVKVPTNGPNFSAVVELCRMKTPTQHLTRSEVDGKGKKLENNLLPSKSASNFDNTQSAMGCSAATSAGNQSLIPDDMIPSRRADRVQVAVAASTSEMSPSSQSSLQKRKLPKQASTYSSTPPNSNPAPNHKAKRRKQDNLSPAYQEGHSVQRTSAKQPKKHGQVKSKRKEQSNASSGSQRWQQDSDQGTSSNSQQTNSSSGSQQHQQRPPKVDPKESQHSSSQSVDITAGPADSSWPENETRIKTSDHYMREGKRLKHEGDACADSRTGRTRAGEALNRALIYYEAALCFIMNGYTLELENANDRTDTSQLSSNMYIQTIQLMDYIRKMRPHDQQEEYTFKRLKISCLRSQALLYLGIYKLKKDAVFKYSETITETLKPNKSNRTPSPWHVVNGQNVVSPVSPAVPSPYGGNVPGPSPVAGTNNTCEQVSSSTQVNKIASPPTQNGIVLTPKAADVFRQFQNIAMNLMQAHEKWDQACALLPEHKDFFRHVDVLTAHELKMNSSLRDLATYNKVILRQLRGAYKSPQE